MTLVPNSDLFFVDIRPTEERYGDLGLIPASISLPLDDAKICERIAKLAERKSVMLYCASGRRSDELRQTLLEQGTLVEHLEGGLLAWAAQGLPVSRWYESEPMYYCATLDDLLRAFTSCFVGELTETILDHELDDALDPGNLLALCFKQAGVSPDAATPHNMLRVLDCAAIMSVKAGTDLERVGQNLSGFLATLAQVEGAPLTRPV